MQRATLSTRQQQQQLAAAPPAAAAAAQTAPAPATRRRGWRLVAHADAALLQDMIVGGAVTAAATAAIANGLAKGEPELCAACTGIGGCECFVCQGSGRTADPERAGRRRSCLGCKGVGRMLCTKCGGSGYIKAL
ncbi:zinc-finger [Micractinium conductrix]|uniref:Zinc-finger n=1 Tax=Micractinium conductrix TaxID=554055 RepID=A0A2P6V8X5_9CHLO|nr:zinc-finger [Micractinium conductrix]|eukprot:PSC70536.1 zinc-finger [Micractinium conductrix]